MKGFEKIEKVLEINSTQTIEKIVEFIRSYVEKAGADGVVLGLSGGLDSSATAYLSVKALGKENVKPVFMPEKGITEKKSIEHAKKVSDDLELNMKEIEISPIIDVMKSELDTGENKKLAVANIKARIRMIIVYYYANIFNYLVIGTSNKTEINCGYFTKYGDGASDFVPMNSLYKTQVREIARELGVPREIIEKKPTAGLWKGQKDEQELGLSYDKIDRIYAGLEKNMEINKIAEILNITEKKVLEFKERKEKSEHKISPPPGPEL